MPLRFPFVALFAIALWSCGSKVQQVGTKPSWRTKTAAAETVFAPSTSAVEKYNAGSPLVPSGALADAAIAMVNRVAAATGGSVASPDARLFHACEELASVVPEDGLIAYNVVEFALQRHGIIEPSPHLLVVWGSIDDPALVMQELEPRIGPLLRAPGNLRLGIGAAKRNPDGTGAVVFAIQNSNVWTSPISRHLPNGGIFVIEGGVGSTFRDPEVFVTNVNGSIANLPLRGDAKRFTSIVECGGQDGKLQVEITALDQTGSTVLANFPVWCRSAPPESITVGGATNEAPIESIDAAEKQMLEMVNAARKRSNLPSLEWDDRVAAVARKYSEEMKKTGVVGHVSPISGSAADRIKAAAIRTGAVLENVARAYSVAEAHEGLMNSPGHRANLFSTVGTHIGIGIVLGEEVGGKRETFVTQVFIRIPPKVDAATAAREVFAKLQAKHGKLTMSNSLGQVAAMFANQIASGQSRDQVWNKVKRDIDQVGARYARVGSVVTAVTDIDSLEASGLVSGDKPSEVGIGIAQGPHSDLGDNAIWVAILIGEIR